MQLPQHLIIDPHLRGHKNYDESFGVEWSEAGEECHHDAYCKKGEKNMSIYKLHHLT